VVAERAGNEEHVAGPGQVAGEVDAVGQDADAGGGDEHAVALALLDHLGVAGHQLHAGFVRGPGHGFDDAGQVGQREALLQDEAGGEVEGGGPHHRHVVDGAVHRQAADVAAGEEQGRDHVAVGGHHQLALAQGQAGAVVALGQVFVAQILGEQVGDELHHGPAAAAVAHVHAAVLDVQGAGVALFHLAGHIPWLWGCSSVAKSLLSSFIPAWGLWEREEPFGKHLGILLCKGGRFLQRIPTKTCHSVHVRAAQAPSDDTMQLPMGFSGVHTVPKILQSVGFLTPRRMAPHSQALLSGTGWYSR
jgi:hypothetical protein